MAGVIKRVACEQLLAFIEANVPALVGKTHIAPGPPTEIGDAICLVAIPHKFTLDPMQADPVLEPTTAGTQVDCIGEVNGVIELQLLTNTDVDREAIEDAINHTFWSQDGRPGIIVVNLPQVQINGAVTAYSPSCAYSHSHEDWNDEFAFSNRKWRFLDIDVTFPALVARTVTMIDHLYLEYTDDLAGTVAQSSVEVLQDGSTVKEF